MTSTNDSYNPFLEHGPLAGILKAGEDCLGWLVEQIFNNKRGRPLKLLPFQTVLLNMLWTKKFPMVLLSRGGGKCQTGNTLVQTSSGLFKFNELIDPSSEEMTPIALDMDAIGENGANPIAYGWNNGYKATKKIVTRFGFEVENTLNHKIRTIDSQGKMVWKKSENIKIGDIIPIVRTPYDFGTDDVLTENKAWFLGATIGDGGCTLDTTLYLTNEDQDIIDEWSNIGKNWSTKDIVQRPSQPDNEYFLNSRDFGQSLLKEHGIKKCIAKYKEIPLSVRKSPKNIVAKFLSGLFDTNGGCTDKGIEYSTSSYELSLQVQACLLGLGILAKRRRKYVKYKDTRKLAYVITIMGSDKLRIFRDEIGFRCKRKQDLLEMLCLKKYNTNIDTIPRRIVQAPLLRLLKKIKNNTQKGISHIAISYYVKRYRLTYSKLHKILLDTKDIMHNDDDWLFLKNIFDKHYFYDTVTEVEDGFCRTYDVHVPQDHTFISNGIISHNTYMLAVYALLRSILVPGTKVVIAGASFRQAKLVFKYIEELYHTSPIVQEALRPFGGPKYHSDTASIKTGFSEITAIPLGDGEKIRGMRATVLICDEFACLDRDTIVETNNGMIRIGDLDRLTNDHYMITGDQEMPFEKPARVIQTPPTDVYEIVTTNGYKIKCSENHKVKTNNGWKTPKQIVPNEDWIESENYYQFPKNKIKIKDVTLDKDLAWALGILLSEGYVNHKYFPGEAPEAKALEMIRRDVGHDPDFERMVEEEKLNAHIARLIYDARSAASLTQKQLADLVGTSQPNIARLEDADYEGHSLTMLRRIAEAYFTVTNTDPELLDKLQQILESKFNLNVCRYEKEEYIDDRGWECQHSYILQVSDITFRNLLFEFGLEYNTAIDKKVPWSILSSPQDIVVSFLKGLFTGDGSAFLYRDVDNYLGVSYYSASERLCRDVQILLNKLGFESNIISRISEISENLQWMTTLANRTDAFDFCQLISSHDLLLQNCKLPRRNKNIIWDKSRQKWKVDKSHLGVRIQKRFESKEAAEQFLSSLIKYRKIKSVKLLPNKDVLYDYYLPVTHSFYADACRQHNSIPEEIFEIVLKPFAAVPMDPAQKVEVRNFIRRLQKTKAPKELIEFIENSQDFGNQVVISGTASYKHNHFYKRYAIYKLFIKLKGNAEELKRELDLQSLSTTGRSSDMEIDEVTRLAKNWKNYAVMQIPYSSLPEDFLDADQVADAKAHFSKYRFDMEYEAKFPDDTDGFIKRSVIDIATPRAPEQIPVKMELYGDAKSIYVLGLDPARWNDNFGAVVLKLTSRGKEMVYCDSWRRQEHKYSANKIREICKRFNIQYIAMDKGGGGDAVAEWLSKMHPDMEENELIWQIPDQLEEKRLLAEPGKKILELVNFISWSTQEAHNLQADIQHASLLFPDGSTDVHDISTQYMRHFGKTEITEVERELISQDLWGLDDWEAKLMSDKGDNKYQPKLGCWDNINECINETCAVQQDVTPNGTERFILPKLSEQVEGLDMRRRDRFSALLLANYAARVYLGKNRRTTNTPGIATGVGQRKNFRKRNVHRRGSVAY